MKTINLFSLFFLLFTTSILQAQYSPYTYSSGSDKISFDLASAFWGRIPLTSEYGLIYSRKLNPDLEISGKLAYTGINILLGRLDLKTEGKLRDSVGVNGVAVGSSIQYFLNSNYPRGWFLGLEANYTYTHFQNKNLKSEYFNLSKLTTSFIVGYRRILSHNVEVDFFIGLGAAFRNYVWKKIEDESSNDNSNGQVVNASWRVGWGLVLDPSIGYATPVGLRLGYRF